MDDRVQFEVRPAGAGDKGTILSLLQLYMYDFSEFAGGVAGPDGRFHYHDDFDERWGKSWFQAYLLWVLDTDPRDGDRRWRPAGFAFVVNRSLTGVQADDNWLMDDFFVMRKYRRAGVGTMLARYCFDVFRGRWQVAEMPQNVAAQAFWRRAIGDYTGGHFEDIVLDNDNWHGPVQVFDNSTA
jgi:predicted acetyltransferase